MKKDRRKITTSQAATQHAALCLRHGAAGQHEVLLITSRDTGRWVLPKGWPAKGETGDQTALREAYEEAGVRGTLMQGCIGVFGYDKTMATAPDIPCLVTVHAILVTHLAYDFPEKCQRTLRWFTPADAASAVDESELKTLLRNLASRAPGGVAGGAAGQFSGRQA